MASAERSVRIAAHEIKHALSLRHRGDRFFTEVKNGPTQYGSHNRIDALAIKCSWAHPLITGYEVKVARSDFLSDDKWPAYLDMCHELYFVAPAGLIAPEELSDGVGLYTYNPENRALRRVRKAAYRPIQTPGDMLMYLIMAQMESDRHPFFSDRREYCVAYVKGRGERSMLADKVKSKLTKEVDQLGDELVKMKRQLERASRDQNEHERLCRGLDQLGIHGWSVEQRLRQLRDTLGTSMPPEMVHTIRDLVRNAQSLQASVDNIAVARAESGGEVGQ